MRLLTYNVHGFQTSDGASNEELVAEVIAATRADVVALNEVFHRRPFGDGAVLDFLARQLGMAYAFGPSLDASRTAQRIPYGNALLSRWPIIAYALHRLPPEPGCEDRSLLEVRIRQPGGLPLTIYVTHLDHRVEAVRLRQWGAALAWLGRDRHCPHVVMGDCNALAISDYPTADARLALTQYNASRGWVSPTFDLVSHVLKAGYVDAYVRAGGESGQSPTWPNPQPERRIDYIFLPQAQAEAVLDCGRVDFPKARQASDHLPVLAEIRDSA